MGLGSKFFLTTSLVILLLLMVGGWSLVVVAHLVDANRVVASRMVPAMRLEASLRGNLRRLVRLEARFLALRDSRYETLWNAHAGIFAHDLDVLRDYLTTDEERRQQRKTITALGAYREGVDARLRAGAAGTAPAPEARETGAAAVRIGRSLDRLMEETAAAAEGSQHEARELERRTWNAVLAAVMASVFSVLVAVWLLAQRMTRTLRRLSAATADVARGTQPAPIEVRGRDEVEELARAFNRMAEGLTQVDQLKQEFFSHISHELRTPLTAVREAVHLLNDRVAGPLEPKQARLVEIIGTNTERVLRLVNRILELSRLRAGLLPADHRWVDLDKIVERAVQELLPQAEARGLALDRDGTGAGLGVYGDAEQLLEVAENLIGNAIKFTPTGGSVTVRLANRGAEVELSVADTGVGIPTDALPSIFDPYRQARGAKGGSGLGLAIVKGIVEAHGGRVRVESREGKGSRFTVALPRRAGAR